MKETIFSKFAKKYDKFSWPQFNVGKSLLKNINIKNKKVLEIGCHAGKLSLEISKDANKIIGIDLASNAIKIAKERAKKNKIENVEFLVRNVENINLREEFDVIISNITFHVFKNKEKALKEMKKVLKKEGILALNFPIEGVDNEEEFGKIYFSVMDSYPYSKYESKIRFLAPKGFSPKKYIKNLFEKEGFKILKLFEEHPVFWFKDEKDFISHYEGSSPSKSYLKHLPVKMRSKAKKEILDKLKKKVTKKGFKVTWGYLVVIARKY